MKLRITYEISYIMNNNCVIAFCKARPSKKFYDHMNRISCDFPRIEVLTKGVSRLKEKDENNQNTACEIAKKKALRTAYREIGNQLNEYTNKIGYYYAQLTEALISSTEISNNLDKDIVDMTRR